MNNAISYQFDRVNVEIINTCNLSCSFCPAPTKAKTVMTQEAFFKIASDLKGRTRELVLHLLGEPLSHPDLAGILSAAGDAQMPINVVTNGVLLNGAKAELLLRPVVRQVSVSLQSFSDNFSLQDPMPYLAKIKAFADRALLSRPDLYLNLRFWDLSQIQSSGLSAGRDDERNILREKLAEVFDFKWADVSINLRRRKNHRLRGRQYLHFDSRFIWPSLDNEIIQERGFCHGLSGHFGIHADGTVVPCCLDHGADIPLGNVFKSPIEVILESDRAVKMREGFKQKKLVEELCKRCGYISRFDKSKSQRSSC